MRSIPEPASANESRDGVYATYTGPGRLAAALDALLAIALDSQVQRGRQWFSGRDYAVRSGITPESAARDREPGWSDTRRRATR